MNRQHFSHITGRLLGFADSHRGKLRFLLQATIVLACIVYLWANARQLQQYREQVRINAVYLLGSWLLTYVALWLGALGWDLVLRSMNQNLPWIRTTESHLASNLAKYLPGYGWQLVGKSYLTIGMGVSTKRSSLAILTELALIFLTGLLLSAVVLVVYPLSLALAIKTVVLIGGVVGLVILILLPAILPVIGRRMGLSPTRISLQHYWLAIAVIILGWLLFGLSFWMLGAGLILLSAEQLPLFIFTLTSSFLVSLAVLIVPGGIGVRESVMVYLLGASTGGTPALIIAGSSRITLLLCEVIAAMSAKVLIRAARNGRSPVDNPQKPVI